MAATSPLLTSSCLLEAWNLRRQYTVGQAGHPLYVQWTPLSKKQWAVITPP